MMTYRKASEAQEIASKVIADHHYNLRNAPFVYVFRDEAKEKNGRTVLGTASKISGLTALLVSGMLPSHDFGDPKDAEAERETVMA